MGPRVPGSSSGRRRSPTLHEPIQCRHDDIYSHPPPPPMMAATGAVAKNQIQPLDGISMMTLFDRKTENRTPDDPSRATREAGPAAPPCGLAITSTTKPGRARKQKGRPGQRSRANPCSTTVFQRPQTKPPTCKQNPTAEAKMGRRDGDLERIVENSLRGA